MQRVCAARCPACCLPNLIVRLAPGSCGHVVLWGVCSWLRVFVQGWLRGACAPATAHAPLHAHPSTMRKLPPNLPPTRYTHAPRWVAPVADYHGKLHKIDVHLKKVSDSKVIASGSAFPHPIDGRVSGSRIYMFGISGTMQHHPPRPAPVGSGAPGTPATTTIAWTNGEVWTKRLPTPPPPQQRPAAAAGAAAAGVAYGLSSSTAAFSRSVPPPPPPAVLAAGAKGAPPDYWAADFAAAAARAAGGGGAGGGLAGGSSGGAAGGGAPSSLASSGLSSASKFTMSDLGPEGDEDDDEEDDDEYDAADYDDAAGEEEGGPATWPARPSTAVVRDGATGSAAGDGHAGTSGHAMLASLTFLVMAAAAAVASSYRRHGALDAQLLRGDMRLALEMGLAALPRFVSDRLGLPAGRPVRGGSGGAMQRVTLDEEAADESDWRGRDSREGSVEAHDGGGAAGLVAHWRAAALGLLFDRSRTAWLGEQWAELRARVAALTGGGSAHTVTSAADDDDADADSAGRRAAVRGRRSGDDDGELAPISYVSGYEWEGEKLSWEAGQGVPPEQLPDYLDYVKPLPSAALGKGAPPRVIPRGGDAPVVEDGSEPDDEEC